MAVKKIIKWVSLVIGGLLILFVAAFTVAMTLGVSIKLDFIRNRVDAAAAEALGRDVKTEGSVSFLVSLHPSLDIQGFRVGNPRDWGGGEFFRAELVRGDIDIISLLSGKIRIGEVKAEGVQLSLEARADGKNNWHFDISPDEAVKDKGPDENGPFPLEFVELRELAFHRVAVTYQDGGLNKTYRFNLDALDGNAAFGEPMLFSIRGSVQDSPFKLSLEGGPFKELIASEKPWRMVLSGKIGQSPIKIDGSLNPRGDVNKASLKIGAEKVSLGGLLAELGIADNMDVDVDRLGMNMAARGGNLKELLERSDFEASLEQGRWFWPDPENEVNMEFTIGQSTIQSKGGKPIELDIDGTIQNRPFKVSLTGDPLAELIVAEKPWQMNFSSEFVKVLLQGKAALVRQNDSPEVTYELLSENVDVGDILRQFNVAQQVKASVGTMRVKLVARGKNPRELLELSDLTVDLVNGKYLRQTPGLKKAFEIFLQKGTIQAHSDKPMGLSLGGKVERKTYSLRMSGGSLASLLFNKEPWSLKMSGKFDKAPASLDLTLARLGEHPEIKLNMETGKIDVGEILNWLQIAKGVKAHAGRMQAGIRTRGSSLQELMAKSDFQYTLKKADWTLRNPNMDAAVKIALSVFNIGREGDNPIKFKALGQIEKTPVAGDEKPLQFQVNATAHAEAPPKSGKRKINDGRSKIYKLKADGKLGKSPVTLSGRLDRRKKIPAAKMELEVKQLDFGGLLTWAEMAEGLEGNVESLKMAIDAKGKDLDNILAGSNVNISFGNGRWTLRDTNTRASIDIEIGKGTLQSLARKPITLTLEGRLKRTPVKMEMQTASLMAFAQEIDRLPINIKAQAAGNHLNLKADLGLPITGKTLNFKTSFTGETLKSLEELLEVSLPPIGPYSLQGRFGMNQKGYRVSDFEVRVGQSHLTGEAALDTASAIPRLSVDLKAPRLQINDFNMEGWSAVKKKEIKSELEGKEEEKEDIQGQKGGEQIKTFLTQDVMKSLDARMAINVNEVLSGSDALGSGSVRLVLENGRLTIDPLQLNVPGGAVNISFAYEPTGNAVLNEISASINKFDYGILARRVRPETKMKGKISLNVKLRSRASELDGMMDHANGYIDFGIWPEDLEAGIFDLWAVNLFTAILPEVDKEETSKINCIIGQYSLKDGQLNEDNMVIDTSRMRVQGDVKADFQKNEVYLYLKSRGKRPEFFSLATPVEVKGKFSDFRIGVASGGLLGTTIRFITSPVHVPFRRAFMGNLPQDGQDVCSEPLKKRD